MAYQKLESADGVVYEDGASLQSSSVLDRNSLDQSRYYIWKGLQSSRRPLLSLILQHIAVLCLILTSVLSAANLAVLHSTLVQQKILNLQHSNALPHTLPTTFGSDRRFMTLDHQYDHLWEQWSADAQIMVPSEIPGEGEVQAGYSMFHQMHCLASMRRAIQAGRAGEDTGFDYFDDGHWPHCFDYLRRSILCWADDNIEIATVVDGKRLPYIDGSRILRQCRSPQFMYDHMRLSQKAVERANSKDGEEHDNKHRNHTLMQDFEA